MAITFLDPDATVSNTWGLTGGAATAHAGLNEDPTRQPTATGTSGLTSSTNGHACIVDCETFTLPAGQRVKTVKLWWRGNVTNGSRQSILAKILDGSNANAVLASQSFVSITLAWNSVTFTGTLTQAQINALRIGLDHSETSAASGSSVVYAAYLEVETELIPVYDSAFHRFRNDDGNEVAATWMAAANTAVSIARDQAFRLRVAFKETNGGTPPSQTYHLYYRRKPAGGVFSAFIPVDIVGGGALGDATAVRARDSANLTDGAATTQQLTSGSFTAGEVEETEYGTDAVALAANASTEMEWSLLIPSSITGPADGPAAVGDTIEFAVYGAVNGVDTYSGGLPSLTVVSGTGSISAVGGIASAGVVGTPRIGMNITEVGGIASSEFVSGGYRLPAIWQYPQERQEQGVLMGHNYSHWGVDPANQYSGGGILSTMHLSPLLPGIVYDQMRTMRLGGVRQLRLMLWHQTDVTGQTWGVVSSAGGSLAAPILNNLFLYIGLAAEAGMERVSIAFGPQGSNSPLSPVGVFDWGKWTENWQLIYNTITSARIIAALVNIEVRFDLLNEGSAGVFHAADLRQQVLDYVTGIWEAACVNLSTYDSTVSCIIPEGDITRFENLLDVFAASGTYPRWFEFHPDYTGTTGAAWALTNADAELDSRGLTQPLVLSECAYNEPSVAIAIQAFVGRRVDGVMPWPLSRAGFDGGGTFYDTPPPYSISEFTSRLAEYAERNGFLPGSTTGTIVSVTGPLQSITGVGGIATGQALGTPKLDLTIRNVGAIATAEAFGVPLLKTTISGVGGIASGEALGTPKLGASILGVGGIATAGAFGTLTLTPGAISVTGVGGIASAQGVGSPSLNVGAAPNIDLQGIPTAEAFGTPTLSPGAIAVTGVGGIASAQALGTPTVTPGVWAISGVGGITTAGALGAPTITITVAPAQFVSEVGGIPSVQAMGQRDDLPHLDRLPGTQNPGTRTTIGFAIIQWASIPENPEGIGVGPPRYELNPGIGRVPGVISNPPTIFQRIHYPATSIFPTRALYPFLEGTRPPRLTRARLLLRGHGKNFLKRLSLKRQRTHLLEGVGEFYISGVNTSEAGGILYVSVSFLDTQEQAAFGQADSAAAFNPADAVVAGFAESPSSAGFAESPVMVAFEDGIQ